MSEKPSTVQPEARGPMLTASPGFAGWMAEQHVSFAVSSYQAGRIFFIGRRADNSLRGHERALEHCQGICTDGQTLWASSRSMLWRFQNAVPPGKVTQTGADRLFMPREGRVMGGLDIHDMAVGQMAGMTGSGPIFVATRYNCLATISETMSFRPLWRPRFISAIVHEDRCHLNGMAMSEGTPAYVTAIAASDVADGWRAQRREGGVLIHVLSGETVATGLSMPHSPRIWNGRIWLLNSGHGELGWIEPESGRFRPAAFCPGYARGLAFAGRFAVVGLSRPRGEGTFQGLPLDEQLQRRQETPRCGLLVIDTETGAALHWLRFEHTIEELYDVVAMPGVTQAEAIGFRGEDLERLILPEAMP